MVILVLSGIVMTAAFLVTLCRVLHWRLVLGYATVVDVFATVLLLVMYAGTFSGMFAATVAGLVLAITLSVGREVFGYTVLRWNRSVLKPKMETVHVDGLLHSLKPKKGPRNAYQNVVAFCAECVRDVVSRSSVRQRRIAERNRQECVQGGVGHW